MDKAAVIKPRRRWAVAEKVRIVQDSLIADASVSLVARANEVNANQVFLWRRQFSNGLLRSPKNESALLPVRVTRNVASKSTHTQPSPSATSGSILIELSSARLRIEGSVDRSTLLTILEALHA